PCGTTASNFDAELISMHMALERVHITLEGTEHAGLDIVVFSDSRSALEILQKRQGTTRLVDIIHNDICRLGELGCKFEIQWIPGHVKISGNEIADTLAKTGAAQPQPEVPMTFLGVKNWLADHFRQKWYRQWADNTTARGVY
ncbi:unnamed protein product, partial [Lymnaea stagnalis]